MASEEELEYYRAGTKAGLSGAKLKLQKLEKEAKPQELTSPDTGNQKEIKTGGVYFEGQFGDIKYTASGSDINHINIVVQKDVLLGDRVLEVTPFKAKLGDDGNLDKDSAQVVKDIILSRDSGKTVKAKSADSWLKQEITVKDVTPRQEVSPAGKGHATHDHNMQTALAEARKTPLPSNVKHNENGAPRNVPAQSGTTVSR